MSLFFPGLGYGWTLRDIFLLQATGVGTQINPLHEFEQIYILYVQKHCDYQNTAAIISILTG